MKQSWRRLVTLASRGSRHQFGVAISLVAIIPALVLYYLSAHGIWAGTGSAYHFAVTALVTVLAASGGAVLARYPITIIRLRRYLEQIVRGEMPEKIRLLRGEDDITAIEDYLNAILQRMSRKVDTAQGELSRIEWLLTRSTASGPDASRTGSRRVRVAPDPSPGSMLELVGAPVLQEIVADALDLVEHAATAYETDGTCALSIFGSGWCRELDPGGSARPGPLGQLGACAPAQESARRAIAEGIPVDEPDSFGLRAYAVPVFAGDGVAGAIAFHYGDPPDDDGAIARLAHAAGADPVALRRESRAYHARPPYIIEAARSRLRVSARLIGEMMVRRRAENVLRRSEAELRAHRLNLEETIQARTKDLEEMNRQLKNEVAERQRAERLKDDFVGVVSHELRTPLSIAKEGVSLLLDRIAGPITDRQEHILATARNSIDRLTRLINDLLDVSRIEAGRVRLQRDWVDLPEVARNVLGSLEPRARQKGIEIRTRFPAAPCTALADADRLIQVFTNLIHNAIRFTERGHIEVIIADREAEIECTIADTGVGIPAEAQPRLFRKFEQFHRREGAGERGTGLGLSIAKSLVEMHGGRIWAESRENEGSRFSFTLPRLGTKELVAEAIGTTMTAATKARTDLAVYVMRYQWTGDTPRADEAARIRPALIRLIRTRRLVRDDDVLVPGEANELVVAAPISHQHADRIMKRIQAEFPATVRTDSGERIVSVTCGMACSPMHGDGPDALVEHARGRCGSP